MWESDFCSVVTAFIFVHWLWHGLTCEPPWKLWEGGCKSGCRSFDLLFFFFFPDVVPVSVFCGGLVCGLLGEALAGLHVFVQQLSCDEHFIQTLAASIIGVIVPADNVIHVRLIVASRVLAEGAEGELLNGYAASLHFGFHWQVVEAVLTWSSCRRQTAVATSCECATIRFGCPNTLAFSRKLLTCLLVGGAQD